MVNKARDGYSERQIEISCPERGAGDTFRGNDWYRLFPEQFLLLREDGRLLGYQRCDEWLH